MTRALVFGVGIAGKACAVALARRGIEPVLVDDKESPTLGEFADSLGVGFHISPDTSALANLVKSVEFVLPAPGVPETHPLFAISRDAERETLSEIELAYRWESERSGGPRPIVAVTGTDGKTTTTLLATAMVRAAGKRVVAVGNTETPFIDALESDAEVFVVECSSFRLALTKEFRAEASVWLNFAPDHLDWHIDLNSYAAAKSRIWSALRSTDVAVAPAGNTLIQDIARESRGRTVLFGEGEGSDYRAKDGALIGPRGFVAAVASMRRSLPHDISNALAAIAICLEAGVATEVAVAQALADFLPSHHRIELVCEKDSVRWFNDSKATSPHAARTALRAFNNIVLIAGGRNKGLDLSELGAESRSVRAVVGIGESGQEIIDAFGTECPHALASSMQEAIEIARSFASAGDVVLLSPACTSFDWYRNYEERGNDFTERVRRTLGAVAQENEMHSDTEGGNT